MEEFAIALQKVSDSYDDFVIGVMAYVKKKPEHLDDVKKFMENNPKASSSDILKFISDQPDFFEIMHNCK